MVSRDARRLAVAGALLGRDRPSPDRDGILAVAHRLGALQLDPTRTVERTHLLVLWSRLGVFDRADLDRLLWEERRLFEVVSYIVPRERLPELRFMAGHFASGSGAWQRRVREWIAANDALRRHILDQLRHEGPLPSRATDGSRLASGWRSSGWTNDRSVTQMLEFMLQRGEVAIAGRQGNQRLWDLTERVWPPATEELSADEYARRRAESVVRRLGAGSLREVGERVWYVGRDAVRRALDELVEQGVLAQAALDHDGRRTPVWVHREAAAEKPAVGRRMTLLSPFDPLIGDRGRTEALFGFRYRLEMYVPKAKREYGHFVLPVLAGDRLVGRVAPVMDRRAGILRIEGVFAEPAVVEQAALERQLEPVLRDLATFLGASSVATSAAVNDGRGGSHEPETAA